MSPPSRPSAWTPTVVRRRCGRMVIGSSRLLHRRWVPPRERRDHERETDEDPDELPQAHDDAEIDAEERREGERAEPEGEPPFACAEIERNEEQQVDDDRIGHVEEERRRDARVNADPAQDKIDFESHEDAAREFQTDGERNSPAVFAVDAGDRAVHLLETVTRR